MKHLFFPEGDAALASALASHPLLAFDFDGTLAPIVADRDAAVFRPATRELLARVCTLYPCAVITGRGREDVSARLLGTGLKHLVGNHGMEPSRGMESFEGAMAEAHDELAGRLADHPGLDVEKKRFSLAIHYRRAPDREAARRRIHAAVADLAVPVKTVAGILVVNIVPEGAPHKGDALLELLAVEGAERALYVGDDVTDEDVFRLDPVCGVVGVRVGESSASAAKYFLEDQQEIDALLETLAGLRAGA